MGSLGETLRQARLDRGVSLADAEDETHIRLKYLEALEAEDFGVLPALVYTRGFIRTYARYLGLDPESTLDLYAPARVREERSLLRPATPQLTASRPISIRIFVAVAGVILAGLLLAYLWSQYDSFVESLSQVDGSPTRVAAGPARTAAQASPVASPTPGVLALPSPSPTPERGVVVDIRVTERTWLEVWVDGASQLQTTLQGGSVRSFSGNQSVRMRVGNAAAVQAIVNGQPHGSLGERNQVVDVAWER
jgi:hypothetical protein